MGNSKTFLIGRDSETGELMTVKEARQDPKHTTVERMPKKGHGDTDRKQLNKIKKQKRL